VVKLADPDSIGGEELFAALHAGAKAETGAGAGAGAEAGAGAGGGAWAGAGAEAKAEAEAEAEAQEPVAESSEDLEFDEESGAGDDSSAASV
jgi:hypothetical protein